MNNIVNKILQLFLYINKKILERKYRVKLDENRYCKLGSTKKLFTENESLEVTAQTAQNCNKANEAIKKIVKDNLKTPDKLLEYIAKEGTKVYKIKYADKILKAINEEEGFITELKGLKALYLNFVIGILANKTIKVSFSTQPMFVLRNMPVDTYYMAHQFYKWYGYKINLPGYDYKTQEAFKTTFKTLSNNEISKLTLNDIVSVKEAINRDNEAIEFVLTLCKETSTSKSVLEKILQGKRVSL